MASFHHGITAQELTQGILPMRNANISTIGLIATASDADDAMYPNNTPVLLAGITKDNIDKAGTKGTLKDCLQTIRDIHNPTVVVLRVSDPDDVDTLDILLGCQTRLGVTPKILGAPEIDKPDVVRKLVSIAKRRRGIVYASPRNDEGELLTDKTEIQKYRDKFGDRELHLIENGWGKPLGKTKGSDNNNHSPVKQDDDVSYIATSPQEETETMQCSSNRIVFNTDLPAFENDGKSRTVMLMITHPDGKKYISWSSLDYEFQHLGNASRLGDTLFNFNIFPYELIANYTPTQWDELMAMSENVNYWEYMNHKELVSKRSQLFVKGKRDGNGFAIEALTENNIDDWGHKAPIYSRRGLVTVENLEIETGEFVTRLSRVPEPIVEKIKERIGAPNDIYIQYLDLNNSECEHIDIVGTQRYREPVLISTAPILEELNEYNYSSQRYIAYYEMPEIVENGGDSVDLQFKIPTDKTLRIKFGKSQKDFEINAYATLYTGDNINTYGVFSIGVIKQQGNNLLMKDYGQWKQSLTMDDDGEYYLDYKFSDNNTKCTATLPDGFVSYNDYNQSPQVSQTHIIAPFEYMVLNITGTSIKFEWL